MSSMTQIPEQSNMKQWLKATKYINCDSKEVIRVAKSVVEGKTTEREKAVAIHDWVRENIKFGFGSYFYRYRASDVLKMRKGFCNTQSTLMCALLRSQGIPARQHFVEISADVLYGLGVPGPFLDHTYTEVYVDGRWVKTDSYIGDKELVDKAKEKLAKEGRLQGYGVALEGSSEWDGVSDSFLQYVGEEKIKGSTRADFGVKEDLKAFYKTGNHNNGGLFTKAAFLFVGSKVDADVQRIRSGKH